MHLRLFFILCTIALPACADNCSDRMTEEGRVIIPRHESGLIIEQAGGSCIMHIRYDLSEDGHPENIQVTSEPQVCQYFHNSARKALLRSKFESGLKESACEHEYTVSLEL